MKPFLPRVVWCGWIGIMLLLLRVPLSEAAVSAQPRVISSGVTSIDAAGTYSVAVHRDGTVTCWGNFTPTVACTVPAGIANVVRVSAGAGTIVAVRADRSVVCWGPGDEQCPVNAATNVEGYREISSGTHVSIAQSRLTGTIVCSGASRALCVQDPKGMRNLQAGYNRVLYQQSTGLLKCMGTGSQCAKTPFLDPTVYRIVALAAGRYHNLALVEQRYIRMYAVLCWGTYQTGTACDSAWQTLDPATAVAVGKAFSLALLEDGTIRCWQLSRVGAFDCTVFSGATNITAIAAGTSHVIALQRDGTVIGWGDNSYGQISVPVFPTYTPKPTKTTTPTVTVTRTRTPTRTAVSTRTPTP
jgi:alpha-tubulin suppressor-like RCC1 family protein